MKRIFDLLEQEHGSLCILTLSHLGGNPGEIENKYQSAFESGLYDDDMFSNGLSPEEMAARDAYQEICGEVLSRWMKSVSRDHMLGLLNALSVLPCSFAQFLPGEELSPLRLLNAWNAEHPEEKIYLNAELYTGGI